jgi:hypothetical protein
MLPCPSCGQENPLALYERKGAVILVEPAYDFVGAAA